MYNIFTWQFTPFFVLPQQRRIRSGVPGTRRLEKEERNRNNRKEERNRNNTEGERRGKQGR